MVKDLRTFVCLQAGLRRIYLGENSDDFIEQMKQDVSRQSILLYSKGEVVKLPAVQPLDFAYAIIHQ